jgi:hypothetical protein
MTNKRRIVVVDATPEAEQMLAYDDVADIWTPADPPPGALGSTWYYNTNTSAPPASGTIRSTGAAAVSDTGTIWLHDVDDQNYDWSALLIAVNDELYIRNRTGQGGAVGQFRIDAITDAGAYRTLDVTKIGAQGALVKNAPVSVTIVRR